MGIVWGGVERELYAFFKSREFCNNGIFGLFGNIYAESGMNPKNLQNSFEKKLGFTDESYTAAVDSGSYKNFVHDGAGYGLHQCTFWSRKEAMLAFHQAKGASIGDALTQAEFIYKELSESFPRASRQFLKFLRQPPASGRLPTPFCCSLKNRRTRAKPSERNGQATASNTRSFTRKARKEEAA